MIPAHYNLCPPPDYWPTAEQARWWSDFNFFAGEQWGEGPMDWYLRNMGDA